MTSEVVIDAHHHVWDLAVRDQPWISGATMAPIRRGFGLDDLRPSAQAAGALATVCKLSGLVTEAPRDTPVAAFVPVADTILSAFGPDRIMFGSGWPVCLLAADYAQVVELAQALTAGLSPAERTAIFCSTAARVYGIAESSIEGSSPHA
jgi:predicted TIM-barrel fold metal-dependent hydrolase